jgi:hypothetical protein
MADNSQMRSAAAEIIAECLLIRAQWAGVFVSRAAACMIMPLMQ